LADGGGGFDENLDSVIFSPSVRLRSAASSSNAASIFSWSRWISLNRGSKCSGRVAPSRIESWNEYRDRYPPSSSGDPNHMNVLWSRLLMGVPVRPNKNAFGSASRIR